MRRYHHMSIPTKQKKEGEIHYKGMKFSSTPFLRNEYRIQWHRFDDDCELPELIKTVPHIAFQVDDLEQETKGQIVIFGPCEPIPGYRIAIVDYDGVLLEFVETKLSDEELAAASEAFGQDSPSAS